LKIITNYNIKNEWGSMKNRSWDQAIWFANTSYVKKKFKWKPKISLKNGLEKTVKWYKEFYDET
jgi:UDP-glucose 4-epimerase